MFEYEVIGQDFEGSHCFKIGTFVRLNNLHPHKPCNNQGVYEDEEGNLQILSSTEVKHRDLRNANH